LSVPQTRAIFTIRSSANAVLKRLSRKHSKGPLPDPAAPALEKLGKTLSQSQKARLAQITLQSYGAHVLEAPGVANALGITPSHAERITNAQQDVARSYEEKERVWAEAHNGPWRIVGGDMKVPALTPEIRRMNDERDGKLMELLKQSLNKEQNEHLAKLLGKPVDLN
jgi:hypothetical protein